MLDVLDTNVLLSALHSDGGPPAEILDDWQQGRFRLARLRRVGDSPDPGDDYLLAMAVTAGADFLVTGDKAILRLKHVARTPIVPPRRFAALFKPSRRNPGR